MCALNAYVHRQKGEQMCFVLGTKKNVCVNQWSLSCAHLLLFAWFSVCFFSSVVFTSLHVHFFIYRQSLCCFFFFCEHAYNSRCLYLAWSFKVFHSDFHFFFTLKNNTIALGSVECIRSFDLLYDVIMEWNNNHSISLRLHHTIPCNCFESFILRSI